MGKGVMTTLGWLLVACVALKGCAKPQINIVSKKLDRSGLQVVYVPAGEFKMGSDVEEREKPIQKVTIDAYWIGKYPVTVAEFRRFATEANYRYDWSANKPKWGWQETHPMVNVNWDDARAYCLWAGGDLPTEAQWEKAARGTDGRKYPWGERWENGHTCSGGTSTCPVGTYPTGASPYGAIDMSGNVCEWCLDWYQSNYVGLGTLNPTGPKDGKIKVLRGGGWPDTPEFQRTSHRGSYDPTAKLDFCGFRLAVKA